MTVRAPLLTAAFWRSRRSASLFSVYATRMAAVITLAVSTVGIRTSAVPRWVCYLGYLVGLTLLVAAGAYQWTQLVFPPWVLLLSLVILFDRPLSRDSHPHGGVEHPPGRANILDTTMEDS